MEEDGIMMDLLRLSVSRSFQLASVSKQRRRRQHESHKSHISFLCNYPRATAYGDRTRLEQVVRNLLTNALNYTMIYY